MIEFRNPLIPEGAPNISGGRAVTIGNDRVGPGQRAYLVAEAGVNHNGDERMALALVDAAADGCADAVKFQVFRAEDLVTHNAATAGYQRAAGGPASQRALLAPLELTDESYGRIVARCHARGIAFLATPFGIADVARVQRMGSVAIKIASTDLPNRPLLDAAVTTGLPIVLSTGASTRWEIGEAVGWLRQRGAGERLVLLHCVSRYPTPLEAINLGAITGLHRAFDLPAGLSDHTTSALTGSWARAAGACLLEKHITLDQSLTGPDHAMSLTPAQWRDYVSHVRAAEGALGSGAVGMAAEETEVRNVARKSVVAAADIAEGDALTFELLTLKRPGTGISPREFVQLIGRRASRAIPRDTVLSWDMVR
ncbi:MAG: N-acetylneuraminate synthase family protein [Phycisphaerae bacterium]|nr:N-acetylneuraminate synthase family protein [Phycisphaerae bacterium]